MRKTTSLTKQSRIGKNKFKRKAIEHHKEFVTNNLYRCRVVEDKRHRLEEIKFKESMNDFD